MQYKLLLRSTLLYCITVLSGCANLDNPYQKFYQDNISGKNLEIEPFSGSTKIYSSKNIDQDIRNIYRNGYSVIGSSSFRSGPQNNSGLSQQAKEVGADIVLVKNTDAGSFHGSAPILQYNPSTTSSTTSTGIIEMNSWGANGNSSGVATYSGQATTTTPGSFSTMMVPVNYQLYDHTAFFFRKMRPPVFGVLARPLTLEMKQKLGSNLGVYVWVVRDGSPAYLNNILEDDLLIKFNGGPVISVADFASKVREASGQKVDVTIWRAGNEKLFSLTLNKKSQ